MLHLQFVEKVCKFVVIWVQKEVEKADPDEADDRTSLFRAGQPRSKTNWHLDLTRLSSISESSSTPHVAVDFAVLDIPGTPADAHSLGNDLMML